MPNSPNGSATASIPMQTTPSGSLPTLPNSPRLGPGNPRTSAPNVVDRGLQRSSTDFNGGLLTRAAAARTNAASPKAHRNNFSLQRKMFKDSASPDATTAYACKKATKPPRKTARL